MKKTCFAILLACLALLLWGCSTEAAAAGNFKTEAAEEAAAVFADGNPDDVTCQGSYTGDAAADTVVATVGGETLTNGELQAWYWAQAAQFQQDDRSTAPDFSQPLDGQSCEIDSGANSWQQYFLKQALNAWHGSTALALQGEAEGLPTEEAYQPDMANHEKYLVDIPAVKYLYGHSESYEPNSMHQAYLDSIPELLAQLAREKGYDNVDQMAQNAFGTTKEALITFAKSYNYGYMCFTTLGYYLEPTEEDFEAFYEENREVYTQTGKTVDIRQILLVPDDLLETLTPYQKSRNQQPKVLEQVSVAADGRVTCSEDAWAACEAEAQALLKSWKNANKTTEASFAALANQNSDDAGTAPDGGRYSGIEKGQLIDALDSWCFDDSRQVGDTTVIRTEYGCHILYFAGSTDIAYTQAKENLLTQLQTALVTAAQEQYPMEVDYSAITLMDAEGTVSCGDILYPDVAHERYPEVPLYLQQDYPLTRYGEYWIRTNGCGITSLAMLASYMTDEEWTPPELCALYGSYSGPSGTDGMIFINEAPVLGFYFKEKTHDVNLVMDYLEQGYPVISLQHKGYWTSGGHYIVLEKLTEDGKIQVRDSNLFNYGKIDAHKADKHSWGSIRNHGSGYWVFDYKVTRIPVCSRCGDPDSVTRTTLRQDYTCHKCSAALLRRNAYLSFGNAE